MYNTLISSNSLSHQSSLPHNRAKAKASCLSRHHRYSNGGMTFISTQKLSYDFVVTAFTPKLVSGFLAGRVGKP
jgi:hypothetical protein